jgi:hypothetical protein
MSGALTRSESRSIFVKNYNGHALHAGGASGKSRPVATDSGASGRLLLRPQGRERGPLTLGGA